MLVLKKLSLPIKNKVWWWFTISCTPLFPPHPKIRNKYVTWIHPKQRKKFIRFSIFAFPNVIFSKKSIKKLFLVFHNLVFHNYHRLWHWNFTYNIVSICDVTWISPKNMLSWNFSARFIHTEDSTRLHICFMRRYKKNCVINVKCLKFMSLRLTKRPLHIQRQFQIKPSHYFTRWLETC